MGYDLFITRAETWPESENDPIYLEEWITIIDEDLELARWSDYPNSHFALWSGKSEHLEPWLDWSSGKIYSKNPDAPLIRKMVEIARRLNARVFGQDGEEYDGSEKGHIFDSAKKESD
jgi:hypothetical protein